VERTLFPILYARDLSRLTRFYRDLVGMAEAFRGVPLLRFSGAVERDPAVQAWLHGQPERLREGAGKLGRHVKLRPGTALDSAALAALITEAYRNIKAVLAAEVFHGVSP
jgi:hypothetical protein